MKSLVQFIREAQSKPTLEWMKEHYEKFNKELFNNELPNNTRLGLIDKKGATSLGWQGFSRPFVMWKSKMRDDMYISYVVKKGHEAPTRRLRSGRIGHMWSSDDYEEITDAVDLDPYIELNPIYNFSDFQKEDTLIHEMIHLWVSRNGLQPKRSHGKEFKRKCDQIRKKAQELYGVEYQLGTKAKHEEDPDKDFKLDKEVEQKMKQEIVQASQKGGGVVSVYMVFDKKRMPKTTLNQIRLMKFDKRFFFCTKSVLNKIKNLIIKQEGLKDIYISTNSYIPFVEKYGKIRTINKWGPFWSLEDYDENLFTQGAEHKEMLNEGLVTEGLVDKINNIIKRIMSVFVRIDKNTPTSEINVEDIMNYTEEQEGEEQTGSSSNDKKMINMPS